MRLASLRLRHVGPFDDTTIRFGHVPDEGALVIRPMTVIFGADGTGKTTLVTALCLTRPGYALPPLPPGLPLAPPSRSTSEPPEPPAAFAEWILGDDDPERPHPLLVTSPSALLPGESTESAAPRRREQSLFDRKAQTEGGFVLCAISGARWFSRATNLLGTPDRSILKYDVRTPASFDDPSRADLTRDVKQVLAYAHIAEALGKSRAEHMHLGRLDRALREVVDVLLEPFGCRYLGTSPRTLEPELADARGRVVSFDALPRPARHVAAFGVLALRSLFAAYARDTTADPRHLEGVVAIDDVELVQEPSLLRTLPQLLRRALPNVQWLLTTASSQLAMACAAEELVTLRHSDVEGHVEVGEGVLH